MAAVTPFIEPFECPDGYLCCVRRWEAPQPVGRIVCLHGIISHGGWYARMCRFLADAGFEVHFLDRRGSGLNPAARGDVAGYRTWLDDVEAYLATLPAPRILAGISWGGKLAAAVTRRRPDLVDGLAMLCPGLFASTRASPRQRLALSAAARLGLGGRLITIPLQQPELFTGSPEWQYYVRTDPLTLRRITVRFAMADLDLNRYVCPVPEKIARPALLMLAGRDRVVANIQIRRFFERLSSRDKTLIEYPAAAHTLEFEPEPEPAFRDLAGWASRFA